MQRSLLPWLGAIVSACIVACTTVQDDVDITGIRTNFLPQATLSKRDLRQVVKLANQCGVHPVAEVYTYAILPSPMHGIGIKSEETVRGREVTFKYVLIDNERWMPAPSREETYLPITRLGKFWTSGSASEQRFTKFLIRGVERRVALDGKVPLPLADAILEALSEGRVRYKDRTLKAQNPDVDFSRPTSLGRWEGSRFSAMFAAEYHVVFTFHDGVIFVSEFDHILI